VREKTVRVFWASVVVTPLRDRNRSTARLRKGHADITNGNGIRGQLERQRRRADAVELPN